MFFLDFEQPAFNYSFEAKGLRKREKRLPSLPTTTKILQDDINNVSHKASPVKYGTPTI